MIRARRNYDSFAYKQKKRSMQENGSDSLALKNFGLLESEFNSLKEELIKGNEDLFEQVFLTQFSQTMQYLISKFNAQEHHAYDTTMSTLIEFRMRIIRGKVSFGNLGFLFTQMCSQRYQKEMGKSSKNQSLETSHFEHLTEEDNNDLDETLFVLLEKSLDRMGENCQKILKKFYYDKVSYKDMEVIFESSAANLRKQKERCITKLKMLIRQTIN